jgi:hypothetical protein
MPSEERRCHPRKLLVRHSFARSHNKSCSDGGTPPAAPIAHSRQKRFANATYVLEQTLESLFRQKEVRERLIFDGNKALTQAAGWRLRGMKLNLLKNVDL